MKRSVKLQKKRLETLLLLRGASVTSGGRVEVDGDEDTSYYRWRRGQLVEIPPDWVGKTLKPQSLRKRLSKQPRKAATSLGSYGSDRCRCSRHERVPRERRDGQPDRRPGGPGHPRKWAERKVRGRFAQRRGDEE